MTERSLTKDPKVSKIERNNSVIFYGSTPHTKFLTKPASVDGKPSAGSGLFSFRKEDGMTTNEVLNLLRAEGFENAKAHILGYGIKTGAIPRPELSTSLQFVWSSQNVSAARRYLRHVPKPGRKRMMA